MVATVIASAFNFLLHFIFSRRFARIKLQFDFIVWFNIIKKSWPLALTIIFNLIYLKADTLILSLIKSQAEVGIYGATYKVIDVLITLPFMFAGIVLPIMTARWAIGNKQDFKNVMQKSFDLMVILALPIIIGTQFVAKNVMVLVAGQEFAESGPVLQVLIIAAGIIFLGCIFAHGVIAIDKQRKIISAYIFTAITAVIGYLIFIPRYSYFGAAWVTIYSEIIIAFASFYLVWKYSRFLPSLKITTRALAACLVMAIIIYFISSWNLFLVLVMAMIVYFIMLYLFKGITKQDLIKLVSTK
jgi:O-antigen/teichoic acid export membrane protein